MWFFGVVAGVFAAAVWALIRWAGKWRDPQWDTREGQSKARLWSKLGSGGGSSGGG